ncbi:MAG: ATP-binding cassette domain-containing protein [Pirellulales bacterium]|jgi:ABC-type sugar transport system ATPase subunit|nr:ATP-binding cassette domain-containing protein [Mariniblastus sp.]
MISVQQLRLCQGDFELRQVSFEIPSNAYAILMGPTGCGKTTLLESICGLRAIVGGKILVGGDEITRTPPAQRQIGYVPQDSSLFPTMKVYRQIAFGMEVRGFSKSERDQRVEELASSLDLTEILDRYPRGLSGGERQRVALARALSFRPRLLCLDEPLSALDGDTRNNLTKLLKKIQQSESVTVLHITHNVEEGAQLGTIHFRLEKGQVREVVCEDSGVKNTT